MITVGISKNPIKLVCFFKLDASTWSLPEGDEHILVICSVYKDQSSFLHFPPFTIQFSIFIALNIKYMSLQLTACFSCCHCCFCFSLFMHLGIIQWLYGCKPKFWSYVMMPKIKLFMNYFMLFLHSNNLISVSFSSVFFLLCHCHHSLHHLDELPALNPNQTESLVTWCHLWEYVQQAS